jgi:hypothetical protein
MPQDLTDTNRPNVAEKKTFSRDCTITGLLGMHKGKTHVPGRVLKNRFSQLAVPEITLPMSLGEFQVITDGS